MPKMFSACLLCPGASKADDDDFQVEEVTSSSTRPRREPATDRLPDLAVARPASKVVAAPPAAAAGQATAPRPASRWSTNSILKETEDSASTAVSDGEEATRPSPSDASSASSGASFVSADSGGVKEPAAGAAEPEQKEDWWSQSDIGSIRSFEGMEEISRLVNARFVRCPMPAAGQPVPWGPRQSEEMYRSMGMVDPSKSYVVCWLNFGDTSLVFLSEATDVARLEASLTPAALVKKLKFILNPVRVGVPVPVKGPKDAETVGQFFGSKGASLSRARAANGAEYVTVQIDMASKMLLRVMLNKVAFREGNMVEMLIADWEGRSVLTSVRIHVTPEALRQIRGQ